MRKKNVVRVDEWEKERNDGIVTDTD